MQIMLEGSVAPRPWGRPGKISSVHGTHAACRARASHDIEKIVFIKCLILFFIFPLPVLQATSHKASGTGTLHRGKPAETSRKDWAAGAPNSQSTINTDNASLMLCWVFFSHDPVY